MASSTKIVSLCICALISTFVIFTEAHKGGNNIIEPFLAAGVLAMLFKNKKYGYGRSNQQFRQHPPAVQQSYAPAGPEIQGVREVQGHVVQEYEEVPHRGNNPRYQYAGDAAAEMYMQPRYVRARYGQPRFVRY